MEARTSFYATDLLKERRMLRGMTQEQFAVRAQVEQSTVSRIERIIDGMRPDVAKRICRALGLSLEKAVAEGIIRIGQREDEARTG